MTTLIQNRAPKIIAEWRSRLIEDAVFNADDQGLVECLTQEPDGRMGIDQLKTAVRIHARSWVGMVRFSVFDVQIVPKLAGDNLGLVELIDYATGLDSLVHYPSVRTIAGAGTSLFDLVALIFVEACERVLRTGLLSDYCEVEDDLQVLRGRLVIRQQVLKHFGRIDRLRCQYDEHLSNIPENQLVLAGLTACARRVVHPIVAMRVRRLLGIVAEACSLDGCDLRQLRSGLIYNRMNEHYREPHELAGMILDGLGIDDIYASGRQRCFAFLLDMNRLFEDFVTRWFGELFQSSLYRVLPQRRDRSILWNAELGRPYKAIIPDLVVEPRKEPGRYLPVDAKYKLYDERTISSSDIYQTFLYAYAYGQTHVLPTALLLYPASATGGGQVRLHVRRTGGSTSAELLAVPIHIPTALKDARLGKVGATGESVIAAVKAAFQHGSGGTPNAENLLVIRSADLATKYTANWNAHCQHAEPYEGKEKGYSETVRPAEQTAPGPATANDVTEGFLASKNSAVFHKAGCKAAAKISAKNVIRYASRDEAIQAGKKPCAECGP